MNAIRKFGIWLALAALVWLGGPMGCPQPAPSPPEPRCEPESHLDPSLDDSFEIDDCASLATDYTVPSTGAQDRTLSGQDIDWVRVHAGPDRIVEVSIGYATLPVQVQVFAPDGETLTAQGGDLLRSLAPAGEPRLLRISARDDAPQPQQGHYRLVLKEAGEDDHPNEPASARELSVPATFSGEVEYYNDYDVAKLPLAPGRTYRIEVSSTTPSNVSVDVLAADGATVRKAVRRFAEPQEWSHFVRRSTAEPVYLSARGTFGGLTGPFSVSAVDLGPDDHGDENIDATQTVTCAPPGPACSFASGRWERPDDLDTFQFPAEHGHIYQLTCRTGAVGCSAVLVSADGRQVSLQGGTSQTSLGTTADGAGPRYISVRAPSAEAELFEYLIEDVGVDDYPGQTLTPIALGSAVPGEISTVDDVDSFSFQGARDRIYQVECTQVSTGDPCRIWVVAGTSGYVAPSRNRGAAFLLTSDEVVKVNVEGTNGFTGAYRVRAIEAADDHGDALATATPITVGTSFRGAAQYTYDVDLFSFAVSAGESYRVTCDSSELIPELTVRDANGNVVASEVRPPPSGGPASAELMVSAPGTFTLAVRPYAVLLRYGTVYGVYGCNIVEL